MLTPLPDPKGEPADLRPDARRKGLRFGNAPAGVWLKSLPLVPVMGSCNQGGMAGLNLPGESGKYRLTFAGCKSAALIAV